MKIYAVYEDNQEMDSYTFEIPEYKIYRGYFFSIHSALALKSRLDAQIPDILKAQGDFCLSQIEEIEVLP